MALYRTIRSWVVTSAQVIVSLLVVHLSECKYSVFVFLMRPLSFTTQPLLITPRRLPVLACQLFFLNYSIVLAASWFSMQSLLIANGESFPCDINNAASGCPACRITANSLHPDTSCLVLSIGARWCPLCWRERFPCPAPPCPCPPPIIDIDRCGADNANLHPNGISRVSWCFLIAAAFNSQLCHAADGVSRRHSPTAFGGKDLKVTRSQVYSLQLLSRWTDAY